jgi:hypothetical protein
MLKRWRVSFDPTQDYFFLQHLRVLLHGLPLHLQNDKALMAIRNSLGRFINVDPKTFAGPDKKLARILVEIDIHEGLLECLDIDWRGHLPHQKLDYLGIPFRCSLCRQTGHVRKTYTGALEVEMSEETMLELATYLDSPVSNTQINLPDYPKDGFSPDPNSITGKLKIVCLTLFFSLSSLEKDSLDNSLLFTKSSDPPCEPSKILHSLQPKCPPTPLPTTTQEILTPCPPTPLPTTTQALLLVRLPSHTSLNLSDLVLPCTLSSSGPSSTLASPYSTYMSNTPLKPTLPPLYLTTTLHHTLATQPSTSTLLPISPPLAIESILQHSHELEEYNRLSGLSEIVSDDNNLDVVLDTLLPSYKEFLSPTSLPTYLGNLHSLPDLGTRVVSTENTTTCSEKDFTWSRGHGFEHSPIKTRSARRKEGSTSTLPVATSSSLTNIGALRGMKALARAKP